MARKAGCNLPDFFFFLESAKGGLCIYMYVVNIPGVEVGRESDLELGSRGVMDGIGHCFFVWAFNGR